MRTAFINELTELARTDQRVFLITGDLGFSVLEKFEKEFPKQFLNIGICEGNMIGVAAGMGMEGRRVFVYTIIPFLTMRCFEQVRNDLAYQKVPVVLVGVGSGLSYGALGATHHSLEDVALMRGLPSMTVYTPGDPVEARFAVRDAMSLTGPAYIRLGKNGEPAIHSSSEGLVRGKGAYLRHGSQGLTLMVAGNMLEEAMKAGEILAKEGIDPSIVSFPTIKPFDNELVESLATTEKALFTIEEHFSSGGLGTAVAEVLAESRTARKLVFRRIALENRFIHDVGSHAYLRRMSGLSAESVAAFVKRHLS